MLWAVALAFSVSTLAFGGKALISQRFDDLSGNANSFLVYYAVSLILGSVKLNSSEIRRAVHKFIFCISLCLSGFSSESYMNTETFVVPARR